MLGLMTGWHHQLSEDNRRRSMRLSRLSSQTSDPNSLRYRFCRANPYQAREIDIVLQAHYSGFGLASYAPVRIGIAIRAPSGIGLN